MINEIGILHERHCYDFACHAGEKTDVAFSNKLVSELNLNAEIKERLISRLIQFKNKFKKGWKGNVELPMEEQSVSNALADTEVASTEEFVKWTAFPPPNGTILFSPNEIKSIMQQLGIEDRR